LEIVIYAVQSVKIFRSHIIVGWPPKILTDPPSPIFEVVEPIFGTLSGYLKVAVSQFIILDISNWVTSCRIDLIHTTIGGCQ
jgi:hypothetical protein